MAMTINPRVSRIVSRIIIDTFKDIKMALPIVCGNAARNSPPFGSAC
jgi:hypothetical protein